MANVYFLSYSFLYFPDIKNSRHSHFNLASRFWGMSFHSGRHMHTESHFVLFQGVNEVFEIHSWIPVGVPCILGTLHLMGLFSGEKGSKDTK